jgi:hypothetical protein
MRQLDGSVKGAYNDGRLAACIRDQLEVDKPR